MSLPLSLFKLDTVLFIIESFARLEEIVVQFDTGPIGRYNTVEWLAKRGRAWPNRWEGEKELLPIAKAIASKGVTCCIIDDDLNMYSSHLPISESLLKRTFSANTDRIYIHQSQHQDLSKIFKWAIEAKSRVGDRMGCRMGCDRLRVHVTKFIGDVKKLESSLNKFQTFFIEKDPGDEDILEAEVASANQLIDLMSDETRKGSLLQAWIHKSLFTRCWRNDWEWHSPIIISVHSIPDAIK